MNCQIEIVVFYRLKGIRSRI